MKKHEVKVGGQYLAKVSGKVVVVHIDAENPHGGWDATNVQTKKKVRIKSAQRLRGPANLTKREVAAAQVATDAAVVGGTVTKAEAVDDAMKTAAAAKSPEATRLGGKAEKTAKVDAWRKEVAAKTAKPDPELDAAIKAAGATGRKKKVKAAKAKRERKPGCLDAAVRVLQEAGKPMQCGEIVQRALAKGYWQTKGATPGATLYAAVLRECAAKGPIGKSLAIVSDARFRGDDISTVAERLLCISGEDPITIDRKYLTAVTLRLPTRFMFLSNDLPQFTDASGALAGRFMVLRLTQNWFGREDLGLEARLTAELPGILLWALQGWVRLHERGRFVQPASSDDVIRELEDLTSPVGAFVRERCVVGSSHSVEAGGLLAAWKEYCVSVGRDRVGTAALFGRNLRAVVPGLHVSQPRTDSRRARRYEGICLCSR